MYFYAQINSERIAFGVIKLPTKIEHPDLIELPAFDDAVVGKAHNADTPGNGYQSWARPNGATCRARAFLSRFTDPKPSTLTASVGATREAAQPCAAICQK